MLWYESTVESSISLCRSLLADKPKVLEQFDGVLNSKGLGMLARRDVISSGFVSQTEAATELEWLKEFLENVHHRNLALGVTHRTRPQSLESTHPWEIPASSNGIVENEASNGHSNLHNGSNHIDGHDHHDNHIDHHSGNHIGNHIENRIDNHIGNHIDNHTDNNIDNHTDNHINNSPPVQRRRGRPSLKSRAEQDQLLNNRGRPSLKKSQSAVPLTQPHHDSARTRTNINTLPVTNGSTRVLRNRPKRVTFDVRETRAEKAEKSRSANSEPKYCFCQRPSFGEMVACDNPKCRYEWFHLACVGLKKLPTSSKWFCSECQKKLKASPAPKFIEAPPRTPQKRNRAGRFI